MNASELRNRVTIEHYINGGRDENGFNIEGEWRVYKKLFANISPLSSRDLVAAQADNSEVVARMKIRHRTDIDTTMRVIWQGRIYSIASDALQDDDSGLEYCTYQLSHGVEVSNG